MLSQASYHFGFFRVSGNISPIIDKVVLPGPTTNSIKLCPLTDGRRLPKGLTYCPEDWEEAIGWVVRGRPKAKAEAGRAGGRRQQMEKTESEVTGGRLWQPQQQQQQQRQQQQHKSLTFDGEEEGGGKEGGKGNCSSNKRQWEGGRRTAARKKGRERRKMREFKEGEKVLEREEHQQQRQR
mgnify:CR=1 FL=1